MCPVPRVLSRLEYLVPLCTLVPHATCALHASVSHGLVETLYKIAETFHEETKMIF